MLDSLARGVVESIKAEFDLKGHIEGQPKDGWLVVDFGDVVVHLLSPDQRDYYDLEGLWVEGKTLLRLQ